MKANKTKDGDKPNGDDEHSKSRQAKRAVVPKKVQGKTKKGAKRVAQWKQLLREQ